ncbi:MAG TPA: ATP-binding protein, partial [Polyangiales bacterium]
FKPEEVFLFRLAHKDGGYRTLEALGRPLSGNPADGIVVNARDVTERIRAEEALRESEAKLRQVHKMEAVGRLAGGIAHDFNNVLFAIQGNAGLALDALSPEHPARVFLDAIDKASTRASELVGQILAFSRPEDQKLRVTQPEAAVQEAINLVRATTPTRIALEYCAEPDTPSIFADSARLVQVVVNLCTNAAHAIGKERTGLIEVRLSKLTVTDAPGIGNERIAPGTYAVLAVSDNGCGMDEATLGRIFDPFFTTKPPGEGSGLGLSVVHGIVRGLGGVISVYSQVGKGSLFRLHFPASPGGRPQSVRPEPPRRLGKGQQVLYVDDEEALVQLGRGLLQALGYVPRAYRSAQQALAAFREDPGAFSAAVTDLTMPDMSGFDLARALLQLRPDLPILLFSGLVGPDERLRAQQLGIRELALKPVSMHELGE